jgi:replicative DNA helicase
MTNIEETAQLIHTTDELSERFVELSEKHRQEPGVTWGIDEIDSRHKGAVLPMRGGDVALIVGRPGDGKTTILSYHAVHEIENIIKRGKETEETVVYATWEGTVDGIYASILAPKGGFSTSDYLWNDVDIEKVKKAAVKHGMMPLIMLGFSTMRRSSKSILMTLDKILDAVRMIQDGVRVPKRKVTLLLLDYLQLIPSRNAHDRIDQVSQAIVGCKNLGMDLNIPTFLGAQASREVDQMQGVRLAAQHHVQWSSQAEQHADKLFAITRPARYLPPSSAISLNGTEIPVTETLLLMAMRKQRGEKGRGVWPLYLRPELLKLTAMEVQVAKKFGKVYDE